MTRRAPFVCQSFQARTASGRRGLARMAGEALGGLDLGSPAHAARNSPTAAALSRPRSRFRA